MRSHVGGLAIVALVVGCTPETGTRPGSSPGTALKPAPAEPAVGAVAPTPVKAYAATIPRATDAESSFAALRSAAITAAARFHPKGKAEETAPVSLTASDGSGLKLESYRARAALEGPLALTELHLTFRNPEPRVIEGRFSIALPTGAAISRFAMKLPSGWQEAEVVERRAAQEAYEDFLHRRQDPALLEKKAGNEFSARIFPIPASGTKEIKITYSQELAASAGAYRLPLQGLPQLPALEVQLIFGKQDGAGVCVKTPVSPRERRAERAVTLQEQAFKPPRDFVVETKGCDGKLGQGSGLRHDNLVLVPLRPKLATSDAPVESLVVLFDTSASRAAGFAAQVEQLGALLRQLGEKARVQLACFDQVITPIFEGAASDFGKQEQQRILERRALGASNLHAALQWAGARQGYRRLLLVTDGVPTAGIVEGDGLVAAVKKLRGTFERLDALLTGGIRDEELMRKLVRRNLSWDGVVLDGEQPLAETTRRLTQTTVSGLEVDIKGARWVWPSRVDGVQPGDEVLIYADLPQRALPQGQQLTVSLAGPLRQSQTFDLVPVHRPLLERAHVAAHIGRLADQRDRASERDEAKRETIKQQIIALSTKHRVLSDYTALLVLETEQDYARFHIDRTALAEILTVGDQGVELMARKQVVFAQPPEPEPPPPDVRRLRRDRVARDDLDALIDGAVGGPVGGVGDTKRLGKARAKTKASPKGLGSLGEAGGGSTGYGRGAPAKKTAATVESRPKLIVRSAPAPADVTARPRPMPPPRAERAARRAEPREAPHAFEPEAQPRRTVHRGDVGRMGLKLKRTRVGRQPPADLDDEDRSERQTVALAGRMAKVDQLLKANKREAALAEALRWRNEDAGDVLALVALGDALKASGQTTLAARAYGSIIDLFPSRADMRRYAGMLLESLGPAGQALAADSFAEAVLQRPDHPNSHRLLAFALLRLGDAKGAFAALEAGVGRSYPEDRFRGVDRILREDLGLVAAVWQAQEPGRAGEIERRLSERGGTREAGPSLRFVLSWETDANDVDFHIHDARGGHAYYGSKELPSGGDLYADVTTGYGPECFTIRGKPSSFPYRLQIHYYSRGPMGYGMGKLEVIQHDGRGGLKFEERPYVVMNDRAFVDLGTIDKPL